MPNGPRGPILVFAAGRPRLLHDVSAIHHSNSEHGGTAIRRRTVTRTSSPLRRLGLTLVAIVCGAVAFAVYSQAAEGGRIDSQVAALRQQNSTLQRQISDHQREIVEAQTVAWLEEEARKLGYVLPGEKVYVIAPPGQATPASGGVNVALPSFAIPTPTPSPTPAATASPSPRASASPQAPATPSPSPH
ncbi:MAG TPA: septum formation initiator family protein [Candidatus Dormibacteraeota bacterium]